MVTLKRLAIVIFSALLTGGTPFSLLAETPAKTKQEMRCPEPGKDQPKLTPRPPANSKKLECSYKITIVKIEKGGRIEGTVAGRTDPFQFEVKDASQLQPAKTYAFDGVLGTKKLSCRTPCKPLP